MMITPPTGLCAATTITAQATEPGRETALPGEGEAVGAVNKVFKVEACFTLDYGNFFKTQLASQHGAGEAEACSHLDHGGVVDRQLRRSVQLDTGEMPSGQTPDPHILQDHRIDTDRFNGSEDINQVGEFFFFNQGIEGKKDFALPGMGITDHALQFVAIDIFGLGPGGEFLEADVNSISAILHGREEGFEAAGRGE